MSSLDLGLSSDDVGALLRYADANGDGSLTYREFAVQFAAASTTKKTDSGLCTARFLFWECWLLF